MKIFEYIWLDASSNFRSKTRILDLNDFCFSDIPIWNYDGSSTGQAEVENSEMLLLPLTYFSDPFRGEGSYLVWCDTVSFKDKKSTSYHDHAKRIFERFSSKEPWFGLEQEYFIMKGGKPLSLTFEQHSPGSYYCGSDEFKGVERNLAEEHLQLCLKAKIKIAGLNSEVAPSQWEYQIGPCQGIEASYHLYISRYILQRVAEKRELSISFHPKPLGEEWSGSGCHINFSTKDMRQENGIEYIHKCIANLQASHENDVNHYGKDNYLRLTGRNETSSIETFSWGVGDRSVSVRIPFQVFEERKGYLEDRRPASNCDPYISTSLIFIASLDERDR